MQSMKFANILVPISGNKTDREAIELACKLAKESKGKIYVVYAIRVKRSLPLDAWIGSEAQKAEEILSQAEDIADEQDYDVETDLLQTREIGPAIVDEAVERGVDLIIMGMNYNRRFGEFDPEETIPYVLKNAPCHVFTLRQPLP